LLKYRKETTVNNTALFLVSLTISATLPLTAIQWLKPLLLRVLNGLCPADGSAEFWLRTTQVLAVSGSLVLLLTFGEFYEHIGLVDALRRTLWLSLAATFVSVALVSRNIWRQIPKAQATAGVQA
jgi:hypothetical protein